MKPGADLQESAEPPV